MTCSPRNIILKSSMRDVRNYQDGDTSDIITTIMRMDKTADKHINLDAVECLRGNTDKATLYNVWTFVKSNVTYKADSRGREVVKSPAALFTIGRGDCKSFSIAEAALLRALGYRNIKFRFAAYEGAAQVTHVYIVCKVGGREYILDAVLDDFNTEEPYTYKKDISAAKPVGVAGIKPGASSPGFSTKQFIGLGLVVLALFK